MTPDDSIHSIHLRRDVEADEDAFGGHDPLAASLCQTIIEEDDGRGVAIMGGFGSGKSTLVNLLHARLKEQLKDQCDFIHFDAWGHQQESLARAFLIKSINDGLTLRTEQGDHAIAWPDHWKARAEGLSSTMQEHVERTEPTVNGKPLMLAAFYALLLLIQGSLLILVEYLEPGDVTPVFRWLIDRNTALTFATYLPLVMVAGAFVLWASPWPKLKERSTTGTTLIEQCFKFPFQNPGTETYVKHYASNDETSLQFEATFRRLLKDLLAHRDKAYRLIFVIDNLDRLEPERKKTAWSAIEVFIRILQAPQFNQAWVIVPYSLADDDDDHRRPFAKEVEAERESLEASPPRGSEKANGQPPAALKHEALRDLDQIRKLFDLEVYVPPITGSDWLSFARARAKESMSIGDEEADHLAAVLMRAFQDLDNRRPTPRDVISVINTVAITWHRWQGRILLPIIGLYVVNRGANRINSGRILHAYRKLPGWQAIGGDIRPDLAMLHYGVERRKAMQLLVQPDLEDALASGKMAISDDLQDLDGLPDALDQALQQVIRFNGDLGLICKAARALEELDNQGIPLTSHALSHLQTCLGTTNSWKEPNVQDGPALAWLARRLPNFDAAAKHLAKIHGAQWSNLGDGFTTKEAEPENWIPDGARMLDAWTSLFKSLDESELRPVPAPLALEEEACLAFASLLQSEPGRDSCYQYAGDAEGLGDVINRAREEGRLTWWLAKEAERLTAYALKRAGGGGPTEPAAPALDHDDHVAASLYLAHLADQAEPALQDALDMVGRSEVVGACRNLSLEHLRTALKYALQQGDWNAAIAVARAWLVAFPDSLLASEEFPFPVPEDKNRSEVTTFTDFIRRDRNHLLDLLIKEASPGFWKDLVHNAMTNETARSATAFLLAHAPDGVRVAATLEDILEAGSDAREAIGTTRHDFLLGPESEWRTAADLIEEGFSGDGVANPGPMTSEQRSEAVQSLGLDDRLHWVIPHLKRLKTLPDDDAWSAIKEAIKTRTAQDFRDDITGDTQVLELLAALADAGVNIEYPPTFDEAAAAIAQSGGLLDRMKSLVRESRADKAYAAIHSRLLASPNLITSYSPAMLDVLTERSLWKDENARSQLVQHMLIPALLTQDSDRIAAITRTMKRYPTTKRLASDEIREQLAAEVERIWPQLQEEIKDEVVAWSEQVGFETPSDNGLDET